MLPRNFLFVRLKVEEAIRSGSEVTARRATLEIVDQWASDVIAAHVNTSRFPLQVQAEFTVAATRVEFGILGGSPKHSPEVSEWVFECNWLMNDRVRYWAKIAARFVRIADGHDRPTPPQTCPPSRSGFSPTPP